MGTTEPSPKATDAALEKLLERALMHPQLRDCVIPVNASLADAMRSLERSVAQIVLVAKLSGELVGTITDGDIRRSLLGGSSLDSPISPCMNREFFSVGPSTRRADILELMKARQIAQMPVVDDDFRIVGLHLLHDLVGATERSNWAVIMAGGKGSRLAPLTDALPKPMLPVAGRPILERLVLHLVGCGIRAIHLAVNYKAEMIVEHFGDGSDLGCHISYLRENEPLDTGGALSLLPAAPSEPLLVLNGDLVTQLDFGALLDEHATDSRRMTIAVRRYYQTIPFGCVEVTDRGEVIHLKEKPTTSQLINAGIYVMEPEVLTWLRKGEPVSLPDIVKSTIERGLTVRAYEILDDWIDVGRHDQLARARGTQ